MRPTLTLTTSVGAEGKLRAALGALRRSQVLVGVPETTAADRQADILKMLLITRGKFKKARLGKAAAAMVNNAQLVYLATVGSPLKNRPPRAIIEPAILDNENKKLLTDELGKVAELALAGKSEEVTRELHRVAQLAENLVRAWFTSPRNNWAPNAASTIRRKGSNRPNIDTAAMRKAIVGVVNEERA